MVASLCVRYMSVRSAVHVQEILLLAVLTRFCCAAESENYLTPAQFQRSLSQSAALSSCYALGQQATS